MDFFNAIFVLGLPDVTGETNLLLMGNGAGRIGQIGYTGSKQFENH